MAMSSPHKSGSSGYPYSNSLHRAASSSGYPVLFYNNPSISAATTVPASPSSVLQSAFLCRLFTAAAISLFLCSLIALLVFLIVHPKFPTLRVDSAELELELGLAESNSSSTRLSLTILFTNPNSKMSLSYSAIDAFIFNGSGRDVASTRLAPFTQSKHEVTRVTAEFLVGQDGTFVIQNSVSNNGSFKFGIKLFSSVKFSSGVLRVGHRDLDAACYPLEVEFLDHNNGTRNGTAFMVSPSDWCSV
ncbi:hypothetical protein PIB30_005876 [Stylosanthes scabra]|uniref:Late embryogenesis abundant protein LEA-2 subgroup domain-containing protein n=1 Tax=Stylosanthes scabra TaxID=79078 RepID=A0ABU6Q462_9FABA|nr:hypothetical protein [Stylosanthes scabra]